MKFVFNLSFILFGLGFVQPSLSDDAQFPRLGSIQAECGHVGETISQFEFAAESGNLEAAYCLGLTHEISGYEEYGMKWLKRSAEGGYYKAQRELADTLLPGNPVEAEGWLLKSALQGDRLSQLVMGGLRHKEWKTANNEKALLESWAWLKIADVERLPWLSSSSSIELDHRDDLLSDSQMVRAQKILSVIQSKIIPHAK